MKGTLFLLCCVAPLMASANAQPPAKGLRLTFRGATTRTPVHEKSERMRLPGLYAGIDAVFYRDHGTVEYDFIVSPYADASRIRISFDGADSFELTGTGDVKVRQGQFIIEQRRPHAYQQFAGLRRSIPCRYRLASDHEVRLELGDYDRGSVLVIDPVLTSQFSPGSGGVTGITDIATDSNGYTYLAGTTSWPAFPVTPGPLSHYNGSRGFSNLAGDVFVIKLAPLTYAVVWSVLVGGSGDETSAGIAVDAQGNVYVSGYTDSPDFPVTSPPTNSHRPAEGDCDLFVFKLNPQGTALVYSTLIGGSGSDVASSLALASDQRVAVVGSTTSKDFPVTANAVQSSLGSPDTGRDAIIVRLTSAGGIDYSTYLGGPGDDYATDVAVDPAGDLYVAGMARAFFPTLASSFAPQAFYGGFVTRLDHATGQFVYSTYIPAVSLNFINAFPHLSIRVDNSQNAYVAGPAEFVFPTTPGAFQTDVHNDARTAFVLELNPAGTQLVFSTLIGGSSDDFAMGLALTGDTVTIAGITNSFDFPVTDHSMPACNMISIPWEEYTGFSIFVASFDHTGKLLVASEYGNCNDERVAAIAPGPEGLLMAVARSDFQVSFLGSIDLGAEEPVQIAAVTDAASFQIGPYCPFEIISIFGRGLGPKEGVGASPAGGYFPTLLAGSEVSFGGLSAPLLYVSDTQINAVVPGNIGRPWANVMVTTAAGVSAQFRTWVEESTPAIFSVNETGVGQGAILNEDGTLNSAANPAAAGSIIAIFGTGGGPTVPAFADGELVPGPTSLALGNPYVTIGGVAAPVSYAGAAPTLVNGAMQVNAQIPTTITPGPEVPVIVWRYPFHSQSGVTVAIK